MKEMRMNLLGAAALTLLLITLVAHYAKAETPGDRIWRISGDTAYLAGTSDRGVRTRVHTVRAVRRLTVQDHQVAARLATYTSVRERRLLRMRRLGHSWTEIARRLDLSPRVVNAAQDALSWHRFLRRTTSTTWCEIGGDPRCDVRPEGRQRTDRRR